MASLVMLSPAPMIEAPGGEVILDVKFVEGMKLHCQLWPGPVRCVLWRGAASIDEPMRYARARLGFDLIMLDAGAPVPELLLDEAAMVYVAADDMKHLTLPTAMRGRMGKLVFTVEEALPGRLGAALAMQTSVRRRIGSTIWNIRHERRLRHALAQAEAIHCNGFPAHDAYQRVNPRALRYLDNRIRTPMMVRAAEQDQRAQALRAGGPLRLVWFGAMDPPSGIVDLLEMAHLLHLRGRPFRLDLIGAGPLQAKLRAGVEGLGLEDRVRVLPPMAFEPELVPFLRKNADIFVSPRRQPTPQSAYIEAMGCGLPILGYGNHMVSRLQAESGAGWAARRGDVAGLARWVERLDDARDSVIAASAKAVEYARQNSFESVFARRMTDLRQIAQVE